MSEMIEIVGESLSNNGIAYESAQLRKCVYIVIQEIINRYVSNGNVIDVYDLLTLIEELK